MTLNASILRLGSSGFSPWKTSSTFGLRSSTFSTSVASVNTLPMPSTASTEKRGTSTWSSWKVYSRRMDGRVLSVSRGWRRRLGVSSVRPRLVALAHRAHGRQKLGAGEDLLLEQQLGERTQDRARRYVARLRVRHVPLRLGVGAGRGRVRELGLRVGRRQRLLRERRRGGLGRQGRQGRLAAQRTAQLERADHHGVHAQAHAEADVV